jgi:hypothetical protein
MNQLMRGGLLHFHVQGAAGQPFDMDRQDIETSGKRVGMAPCRARIITGGA